MIELISRKSTKGDISVTLAKKYLQRHEWGLAKKELERALRKSSLDDLKAVLVLYTEVCNRLDIKTYDIDLGFSNYTTL